MDSSLVIHGGRRALLFVPLLALACSRGEASTSPSDEERALLGDPEVIQELNERPRYTIASIAIRGEYASDEGCAGGFDACYHVAVKRENYETTIELGEYSRYPATVWSKDGVVLFMTDEMHDECDDPGCGNMRKITGVIYPVKQGEAWVPRMKAMYTAEFRYPEEEESPSGIVRTTLRLNKP